MTIVIAALAALVGVGSLLLGALVAWRWEVPKRAVAGVMAFGAGVLMATLALALVHEASVSGGVWPVVAGFTAGAVLYVGGDQAVVRVGRRRRARTEASDSAASRNITARRGGESEGDGAAIAVGALLDGIPEAIVIGLAAVTGSFPVAIVAAIGLSNVPEGLAGTVALRGSGRSSKQVFFLWGGITAFAVVAAVLASALMGGAPPEVVAIIMSVAAGALLAMVCNAMIPEAFDEDHWATGLVATAGFLVAFVLHEVL
ncbi:ZIP family metal transporter [Demequina sp. SO4-18]|uniref:ZIP family metal transporter n=1 Tax=Demequina sp. SO4-18 TaxID=3401026 RepID=UPI003B5A5D49